VPEPGALPDPAPLLLVIGYRFGADVSQVTELVRSLTVGAVEKVPIARNCPLAPKSPKSIPLGMMVSERIPPPLPPVPVATVPGTVRTPLELTGPLYAVALAVIEVVPGLTAVASPLALTVATDGMLDVQVTVLVMFCVEA
jgi:hypothetical protein